MKKKQKNRSRQWLRARDRDQYIRQARQSHYRSRAVYKLREIDQKDNLIKPGDHIVDLGSAPGAWSQYAHERVGAAGRVIAVDMLPMETIPGVLFIPGDFTEEATTRACLKQLGQRGADLVISDMAPNISGIRSTDQAGSMALAELLYHFCLEALKPGGHLLVKLFEGDGVRRYRQLLRGHFERVVARKPDASRDNSREFYILASTYAL